MNWLAERYLVIGEYPGSPYKIGETFEVAPGIKEQDYSKYPLVFKRLEWYQSRNTQFDELFKIKFCKIVRTCGYWRNGDILPVIGYMTETNQPHPTFIGFLLKGYGKPEEYEIDRVEPTTENEFLKWKAKNKVSITAPR